MASTVLVIGGTGLLGGGVAAQLVARGHRVVVGSRDPRGRPGRVVADLRDTQSLEAALDGVDAVVATMPLSDGRRDAFIAETDGTRNLLAALRSRPSLPLIKLSEIGAGEDPRFFDLQCKAEAENMVRRSGQPFLILRPPWVMQAWPAQLTAGSVVLVPTGRQPLWWVSTADLGGWVAGALTGWDRVAGRTLTAQGPEGLTFDEAGRRYAQAVGARRVPLPTAGLRLAAPASTRIRALAELFRFYARSDQSFMSQELHDLLGPPAVTFEDYLTSLGPDGHRARLAA